MVKHRPPEPPQETPRTLREYLAQPDAMSQYQLARAAGTTQSMISAVKRNIRACRGKLALAIHHLTGVPVEELVRPRPRQKVKKRKPSRPRASVATAQTLSA